MCTVTSHRVWCGCTVWLFTTLGECGLSLCLGLRPIKTHSSNHKMKSNYCVLGKARKGLLVPLIEKFCVGVRDSRREPKVLYGCKRPAVLSKKFYMGVRDSRCDSETFV